MILVYWAYVKRFFVLVIVDAVACTIGFACGSDTWIWVLACSVACFVLLGIMLGFVYSRLISGDWDNIADESFLQQEDVDITMSDGFRMACKILKAPGHDGQRLPVVICHHGLTGNGRKLLWLAIPLAMKGYLVILPDARAHGRSAKRFKQARMDDWYITGTTGIMPDYKQVLDHACSRPDADASRVVAIGHSLGGATSMVSGLPDQRVSLVISMSAYYSFVDLMEAKRGRVPLTEPWFSKHFLRNVINFGKLRKLDGKISPKCTLDTISRGDVIRKLRVVHARDDKLVLPEASVDKIVAHARLPGTSVFITKKGDHNLRGQETAIVARIEQWLDEAFGSA